MIVAAALLIRPVGEFPILDDFDYAATVGDFLRTGEIRLSDWPSMTLVGQGLWGAAFSKVLGFSFLTLRISTLVLHGLGCLAAYAWMRGQRASQQASAFGATAVGTSPETLLFACTFMTDVPGLAWTLILLAASARSLDGRSPGSYAAAGVLGAVAYLFRQTAVIPLLAAVSVELTRRRWLGALLLVAPTFGIAAWHHDWLERHGVPHHASIPMINPSVLADPGDSFSRLARLAATSGLYLAPVAVLALASGRQQWNRASPRRGVFVLAVAATAALTVPAFVPFDGSVVFDCGLGADMSFERSDTLSGPSILLGGRRVSLFQTVATTTAILSLAILGAAAVGSLRTADPIVWHFRLSLLGTAAFALISGSFYERYMIPCWSLTILGLAVSARRVGRSAWGALVLFAALGIVGAEDYFRRFGTVWRSLEDLRAQGVPATLIDGGMEFAGYHLFNTLYRGKPERVRPFASSLSEANRLELISPLVLNPYTPHRLTRPYAVWYTFSFAFNGEQVLRRYEYRSWVRSGTVYVVQRRR